MSVPVEDAAMWCPVYALKSISYFTGVAPGDGTGVCLPVEDAATRCPVKFGDYFTGVAN